MDKKSFKIRQFGQAPKWRQEAAADMCLPEVSTFHHAPANWDVDASTSQWIEPEGPLHTPGSLFCAEPPQLHPQLSVMAKPLRLFILGMAKL